MDRGIHRWPQRDLTAAEILWLAARDYYREHPEGITDEQVGRALAKGHEFAPEDDGFQAMRACLETALFPGDQK